VGAPPRFYPNAVTVDPDVDAEVQTRFLLERAGWASRGFAVKDSFRSLALDRLGFAPFVEAQWIHRAASLATAATRLRWAPVTTPEKLRAWEAAWGADAAEPPLFLPEFLANPEITVLAGWAEDRLVAGCILSATGSVVGISNVFGDAADAIHAAATAASGLDLVGYESGEALGAALAAGFQAVGDLVVWVRP
jgi:hypothetical protein